jgi:Tfp pilus assembly protein PilV
MTRPAHNTFFLKGEAGITLVEVLAAMVILSVGILAMAPMMVISIHGNTFSTEVSEIASAAQLSIEEQIGAKSFASMPYVQCDSLENGKYEVVTVVTDESVDASIPAHVYQIDVTVNWTDDAAVGRSMTFSTFASKY